MTNSTSVPLDEVRGLIEERERYDGWLQALEARRANTPPHVFDRVRSDYDARYQDVNARLAAGLVPLREAEGSLARRQDEIVRTLGERQDELAELELRTLVGEFGADDGERRIQAAASVVRELDSDRRNVSEELDGVRAVLQRAESKGAGATPAPAALSSDAAEAPVAPAVAPPVETVASPTPAASTEPIAAAQTTPPPTPPEPPSQPWARQARPGGNEAFVGTGERLDSLAAALGGNVSQAPAAAATSGQEKTLRCQDCGEMNYPTEWYCERCGGELAAL